MRLARCLLLVLVVTLTTGALAAEKPSAGQTADSKSFLASSVPAAQIFSTQTAPVPYAVLKQWAATAKQAPNSGGNNNSWPAMRKRAGRSLADSNGDVCFTMRVYKIKPTERIREGETVDRGYSECEMASDYQIHSAEAHDKEPAKLK